MSPSMSVNCDSLVARLKGNTTEVKMSSRRYGRSESACDRPPEKSFDLFRRFAERQQQHYTARRIPIGNMWRKGCPGKAIELSDIFAITFSEPTVLPTSSA